MNAPEAHCYAFGQFHFDALRGVLSNGLATVELRPKAMAVLHYLVSHPHRLVGKDEFLTAVWGNVVVTEDSLVQCVREVRQALGDTDQRMVRTIPRGGYMFTGEVQAISPLAAQGLAGPPPPAAQLPRATADRPGGKPWFLPAALAVLVAAAGGAMLMQADSPSRADSAAEAPLPRPLPPLSIVVLPLANIGGDPEHEYFAQGLSSDLATDLGRIPAGSVISPNSARAYRGVEVDARKAGRELGARYVIEGSVQRIDDDVRVNLRLVDSMTGEQRWAERFEGPRAQLPQMQVDIVRRIARTLQVRLLEAEAERGARERTLDPGAQDLLMRGWALWERRRAADNALAREFFLQAVAADPRYSLGWVGLANTHLSDLHAGWSTDRKASLDQAGQAIARAYEFGPRHREVNAVRGYLLFFQGDVEGALSAFDLEIEVNAGNALAHVWRGLMLVSLGRAAEALPSIERGLQLSPRDVDLHVFYRSMAHAHFSLGRHAQAVSWSQKAVGHTPGYVKGYAFLAAAAALAGQPSVASGATDSLRRLQPKFNSTAAFRGSMMPGELRMFDATPRFWEALQGAGLPAS